MQNRQKTGQLPNYKEPPVVETILGVQFDPMPSFTNAHLGAFWSSLEKNDWPSVNDAPLLQPQFEKFIEPAKWEKVGFRLQLTQDASSRLQIKNKDGNRMIQVQNGRLHYNWLGQESGDYPRYDIARKEFDSVLRQLVEYVAQEELGDFHPNQWEVTYLNHIPKGTVWNRPGDWGFFRLLGAVPTIENLACGESFNGEWHFVIPEQRGRLHVQWQHVLRSETEQEEIVRLTLTARGPVDQDTDSLQAVFAGLDLGRHTIVCAFKDFMSVTANQHWGLKHVDD